MFPSKCCTYCKQISKKPLWVIVCFHQLLLWWIICRDASRWCNQKSTSQTNTIRHGETGTHTHLLIYSKNLFPSVQNAVEPEGDRGCKCKSVYLEIFPKKKHNLLWRSKHTQMWVKQVSGIFKVRVCAGVSSSDLTAWTLQFNHVSVTAVLRSTTQIRVSDYPVGI